MTWFKLPTITPAEDKPTLLASLLFVHHSLEPLVLLPLLVGLDILVLGEIFVCNVGILVYHHALLFGISLRKLLCSSTEIIEVARVVISSIDHSVSPCSPEAAFKGISLCIVLICRRGVEISIQLSVLFLKLLERFLFESWS